MLVNNTNAILSDWPGLESSLHQAIAEGREEVPDDFTDIFTLRIINVNGQRRGLLEWYADDGWCGDCGLPLDECGQCSSYLAGAPCAALAGPLDA